MLALNSGGIFLFAANGSSRDITRFAVDPATGTLSGATTQPADTLGNSGLITGLAYSPSPSAVGTAPAPLLSPNALIVVVVLLVALGLYQITGRRRLDSQRLQRVSRSR